MFDFPYGLSNIAILVGLFALLLFPKKARENYSIKTKGAVGAVLLVASATTIIVAIVMNDIYINAVVSYAPANMTFLGAFLLLCLLNHLNLAKENQVLIFETAPLQLLFTLLGSTIILANNLIVFCVGCPALLLILWSSSQLGSSRTVNLWPMIFRFSFLTLMICFSSALFIYTFGTADLKSMTQGLGNTVMKSPSVYAWAMMGFVFLTLSSSFGFFSKEVREAKSWGVVAFFRCGSAFLALILLFKWVQIGVKNGFWPKEYPDLGFIIYSFLSVCGLLRVFLQKKTEELFFLITLQPLLILLIGSSFESPLISTQSVSSFLLAVLFIPFFTNLLITVRASTMGQVTDLQLAMRAAPKFLIPLTFLLMLIFSPVGSVIGFDLFSEIVKEVTRIPLAEASQAQIFVAAMVLFVIFGTMVLNAIFLRGIMGGNAEHKQTEVAAHIIERFWVYTLSLPVIVLGIYPPPLYNYVISSIKGLFSNY